MSDYHDFLSTYSIRNIQWVRGRHEPVNFGYNKTASYYADRDEFIEMELPRIGFERLVKLDREYTLLWQDNRDEAYYRKKHPAVAEAYSKYRMLLELYK